jgi:hypothetical protein
LGSSAPTPSEWLSGAARRLGVVDPSRFLGGELEAFSAPLGDPGYAENALLSGAAPLEVSFSEAMPGTLRLDFEPAARAHHGEARRSTTATLVRCVATRFGPAAAADFQVRATALCEEAPDDGFRLFVGAACDAEGLREVKAYYPVARTSTPIVAAAKAELSVLRELMQSVAVSRDGLAERAYLVCSTDLELFSLEPMLERFGLGHRVPEVVVTLLRLTGDSFVLPPSSCVIGLRSLGGQEVEAKIEVLVGSIPLADDPETIAGLFAERPASQTAFRRWLEAVAPPRAGLKASVVSVRVTRTAPVSINVYVHPVVATPDARAEDDRKLAALLG